MRDLWRRLSRSPFLRRLAPFLVIAILVLPAVHPLTFGALPDTPDGLLHLYRLIALDHAIRHGDLWPRYVPGALFGYGAPIFNFYAPLSLYPLEILHLIGLRFLDALLVGMALYTFAGALGAYRLGEAWGGPVSGITASVAYTYAPYILYDWPRRGAVAEYAALMLLPWLLWAFWRLAMRGRRRDFVLAALCFATLILTHNITALYGAALLGLYALFLWWHSDDPPRAFWHLGLALIFGLGLSAFFWLPALLETRYVFIERVTEAVAALDFRNNFQTLSETLSPPLTADLTQLHPPVPRPLGWPQILLGVAGIGLSLWPGTWQKDDPLWRRRWPALMGLFVIALLFLTTHASIWLWEIAPLARFIQFPWRLLGPASLFLALLAGAGATLVARRLPREAMQAVWVGLGLLAMIIYALPWLYGLYLPDPPAASIADVQNFERRTGWLAMTSAGEYVPRWTTELPDTDRLAGLYAQDEVIPRLQPNPTVTVNEMRWGAMDAELSIEAAEHTTLVFDWVYFPGWWAEMDGERVTITPTEPNGLLGIEVPPGEHTLRLGFGPTPLRLGAMIASLTFLAGLIAVLASGRMWSTGEASPASHLLSEQRRWPVFVAAVLAGSLAFGVKVFLVDNLETPLKRERFANGLEAGVQVPVRASSGHDVTLLGYDLRPGSVRSGRSARLNLYWQLAGGMINEDYSSIVYLRDAEGNVVLQTGSQHPGDWPTSDWLPGFYVQERLTLDVPPATPPGVYAIRVALYSHLDRRNLDTFDVAGNPLGVSVEIGTLTVTRPRRPARLAALEIDSPLNARQNQALTLISASAPPTSSEVGQPFPAVWIWRARRRIETVYQARLVWLDGEGEIAAATPEVPLVVGYPTDQWRPGDVWRGLHVFYVPGSLDAGDYQVAVQVVDAAGEPAGEWTVIGRMAVSTPPRVFEMPRVDVVADTAWENGIRLRGYDLPAAPIAQGNALELTFYWQTGQELTSSLTVFVHLVDGEGNIAAQRDSIPASGARPTTGWAPGEVIEDHYTLLIREDVPPGVYYVRVGWYNATTGERVRLAVGGDFWLLPRRFRVVAGP